MGNGVEAWRQEISAAKSEVKDDLRHESAARDSVLQSFLNSALETLRRMQTDNKAMLDGYKADTRAALDKFEADNSARLDKHESDIKAALTKHETDNNAKWAKYESERREERAEREADTERREKRLMGFILVVVVGAVTIAEYVFK